MIGIISTNLKEVVDDSKSLWHIRPMTATTTTEPTQEDINYFSKNFSKKGLSHLRDEMMNKLIMLERQHEIFECQAKSFTNMARTTKDNIVILKEELENLRAILKQQK